MGVRGDTDVEGRDGTKRRNSRLSIKQKKEEGRKKKTRETWTYLDTHPLRQTTRMKHMPTRRDRIIPPIQPS